MEHNNPLLSENQNEHRFITIGEIMLRLTPPSYEKVRMASAFEAAMAEARQTLPWRWQTWGSTVHFLRSCRTTAWEKARSGCCGATMYTARP